MAYLERKIRILQRKLLENRKRSSGLTVAHKILRDARKLEELERRTRPGHSDR